MQIQMFCAIRKIQNKFNLHSQAETSLEVRGSGDGILKISIYVILRAGSKALSFVSESNSCVFKQSCMAARTCAGVGKVLTTWYLQSTKLKFKEIYVFMRLQCGVIKSQMNV